MDVPNMLRLMGTVVTLILWQACATALAVKAASDPVFVGLSDGPRQASRESWHIKSFLEDAGLTGRFVFFVDFDREGNAWIASAEGLYFFDGYTWTRFSEQDGLPSNFVRSLRFARDGTLWIGTNKGLATMDVRGQISIPNASGLAGPNIRRIVEDDDGTLWFCSDTWLSPDAPAGLTSYRQGQWSVYSRNDGLPSNYVSDYFRDSTGRQFVLSRDGQAVNDGSGWSRPLEAGGFVGHNDYFWSIAESRSTDVLMTTEDALFLLKNGQWSRIEHTRLEFSHLRLTTTRSGEVITLTSGYDFPKHFMGWNGSEFVPLSESCHFPGEATYVTEAPDGCVWSVGYNLLLRWERSHGEWTEYPDISAPRLVDSHGRLWFTAGQTILRLTGDDKWDSLPYKLDTITHGRHGEVLGFTTQTVFRFVGDDVMRYGPDDTSVHGIRGHTLDGRDRLWIHGADQNERNVISVFDGESWHAQSPPEIQGGFFNDCAPHPEGGVYYLLSVGPDGHPNLIHVRRHEINRVDLPGIASSHTPRLHVDYQGCLWVCGQFGLFTLTDSVWSRTKDVPGERVLGAMNGNGETWFSYDGTAGGRTGLGRLRDGEWSYFNLDKRPRMCGRDQDGTVFFGTTGVLYNTASGLKEAALSSLTLPVRRSIYEVVRGPTGDLWVGLGDKVLRFRSDRVPPQTLIVDAEREARQGDSLGVTFASVERFKPRGERTFEYSWRIGSEPWTAFGPAPIEGVPMSLDPGRYTLEVRARDEGSDIDPTPARTEFRVVGIPWPQRPWFWPLTGAVLGGLALLGVAALVARNRARFHAAELERLVRERTGRLTESEARFRAMTAAAPLPLVITRESDGVVLYANSLLGELLGVPSHELVGRCATEFLGQPSDRLRMLAQVNRRGYVQGFEISTRKANGTPIWGLVSLQRMIYDGQPALIGGLHDITERKHTAQELERARAAAEAASRAKSVFLASLTHEFRTPIMAMLSAAEASATASQSSHTEQVHADIIFRNGRHLISLFDNLLDFARLEAGKFTVCPVRCSLLEILADVHSVVHPLHQSPEVDLRVFCEGAIPREIETDPLRLKQALINLVSNALKYTEAGSVHVRVKTNRHGAEPRLSIAVEDTGPGIPEAELDRIFDAFEQVEPRGGQQCAGVGLGLSLAQWIARKLGGTLTVDSREGHGSTFTLRVATGAADAEEWITPGEIGTSLKPFLRELPARAQPGTEGSVLLAEDARDARELIAHALRNAGVRVTAVENGREAVEAATKRVYDLVLLDIRMPVMDGLAATVELRRRGYLAPIIALTASVTEDDYPHVLGKGFDDVWGKPISLKHIIERTSNYMPLPSTDRTGDPPGRLESASSPDYEARRASLAAEFARDLPARFQAIKAAVDKGDMQTAREVLHQLAGTGGVMGFMPLSEEARRVLQRIKDGTCARAKDEFQGLEVLIVEAAQRATKGIASGARPDRHRRASATGDSQPTAP
ncbi:MAG: ATP-binding protein [Planctomycetota bacterium]|jgi:PAS domain S-box-containing protein